MKMTGRLKELLYEDRMLFGAAIATLAAIILSIVRFAVVAVRFFTFNPLEYDEEEMMRAGFYNLVREDLNAIDRFIARFGFAQSASWMWTVLYVVLILFAVAFLLIYIDACMGAKKGIIPGVLFAMLTPASAFILIQRRAGAVEALAGVPNWVFIVAIILGFIALVVAGYFAFRYNDEYAVVNAKFFLISMLICCVLLPGLSYILFIGGVLLGLFILFKVVSLFSGPLISHTFTVTDHETGESATFSKDDVDVILKKKR